MKQYAENVIAIIILTQVNSDVNNSKTLDGIMDYKRENSTESKSNEFIKTKRGVRKLSQTTIVRKLLIQWKYGTTTWIPLKIMKESSPFEGVEFVFA